MCIRPQDFADERRRTAAGIDVLEGSQEGQEVVVGRHVASSALALVVGLVTLSQNEVDRIRRGQAGIVVRRRVQQHTRHDTEIPPLRMVIEPLANKAVARSQTKARRSVGARMTVVAFREVAHSDEPTWRVLLGERSIENVGELYS